MEKDSIFGLVGLGIGLLITLATWLKGIFTRSSLRKEIDDLKKNLNLQMQISARGNDEVKTELDRLRKENENLRITVATLSNKPGRTELKTLHVWDKAIRILIIKSPAFAPAWEMSLEEAKKEIEETNQGVRPLIRKAFTLFLPQAKSETSNEGD
ncbi:hypothetical protein V2H45_21375 [Tumidithrix elongata RA019]|uniref:Uncharacterized protein n=1 Tax=Tumidithrix elongata BACA0141 TaxID=2716417 RepID=A0AAW9Q564_9CYAN|nr:hypothetical protein [Tumidithrix elongata RA019]